MENEKQVWAPDVAEGFKLGRIVDIGTETISVSPLDSKGQVWCFVFLGCLAYLLFGRFHFVIL